MNDLEERLRADLLRATASVEDNVDAEDALLAGQRARSSRRIGATIGVTAMAAVVGLVSWTVLRAVPIHGGVPSPLETISAVPSTPATPGDPMSASFDLTDRFGTASSYGVLTMTVEPEGGETSVVVRQKKSDASAVERRFTAAAGKVWLVRWEKHLVIGIVPDRAAWIQFKTDAKGSHDDTRPLDGIGATAFWIHLEDPDRAGTVQGLVWEGADGVVRDSTGVDVPTARLQLSDGQYLIYRDEALDMFGVRSSSTEVTDSASGIDDDPAHLLMGGFGSQPDGGDWTWTQNGVLPPGTTNVKIELTSADGDWGVATFDDGWVAVVAWVQTSDDTGNVIKSLTYADASGRVKSFR